MASDYWSRYWKRRTTRRRVLTGAAIGSTGVAALGLIGCGDDDDDDDDSGEEATNTATSGGGDGTAEPSATDEPSADTPKQGGTWRSASTQAIPSLDPYASASSSVKGYGAHVYSKLFTIPSSQPDASGAIPLEVVPDAAESIEAAADGLSYTVTLRSDVKFHSPVSRLMDAEDVVFSWQRFTGRLEGGAPAPNADRLDVIEDVQAVDDSTVVFHLSRQYGPFPELLADATTLLLMPKETGDSFDPAQVMIGSGPWMFDDYVPGSSLTLVRNPDWHFGPDRPYLDKIEHSIVGEAAAITNQFMAGNIDSLGLDGLNVRDVVRAIPDVQVFEQVSSSGLAAYWTASSVTDPSNTAPWTDRRVRRAMSMALDREAMLEATYNLSLFAEAGVELDPPWQGLLPRSFGQFVLDASTDPDLAQFFEYNPQGARDLLEEAGGGFSINVLDATIYGAAHDTVTELTMAFWNEIGIETNFEALDYTSDWIPNIYQGANYEGDRGIAHIGQAGINEPGTFLRSALHPDATLNQSKINDPMITALFDEYFPEPDLARRIELLNEIQRRAYEEMYYIPSVWGAIPAITAVQPDVRGYGDHLSFGYGAQGQDNTYYWKA